MIKVIVWSKNWMMEVAATGLKEGRKKAQKWLKDGQKDSTKAV